MVKQLKDIASIHSGTYLSSCPMGEVAYIQLKDLTMETPETTATRVEYLPKMKNQILQKGDILFASKGTSLLCKIFNYDILAVASSSLFSIRINDQNIMPEYICWYLNHPEVSTLIKAQQTGSSTLLLHKSILENLRIPIPELDTQKKIVKISKLQQKEQDLMKSIAEKRALITNQILLKCIRVND